MGALLAASYVWIRSRNGDGLVEEANKGFVGRGQNAQGSEVAGGVKQRSIQS